MKHLLITLFLCASYFAFSQPEWKDIDTPGEKMVIVISTEDTSASAKDIYNTISSVLPELQQKRVNNKKVVNAQILNAVAGGQAVDGTSKDKFSGFLHTDSESGTIVFNVQDIIKTTRVYYQAKIQIKPGRYRVTITPAGTSGTALLTPNVDWSYAYKKNGDIKGMYKPYLPKWRALMEAFSDELGKAVNENLGDEDDW